MKLWLMDFFAFFYEQKNNILRLCLRKNTPFRSILRRFAEFKLQTENFPLKLNKKASTSRLVATMTILPPLFVWAADTCPLFCLFVVCSSEDSCKQTRSKQQRAGTHAWAWQQAAAPPGGNKDFYSLHKSVFLFKIKPAQFVPQSECFQIPDILTSDGWGERRAKSYASFRRWSNMQWAYSGVSIMATPATSNMTNTKQNKETKQETVFLSSPSLARCCHSVRGALGSFKRNFTGTEWF